VYPASRSRDAAVVDVAARSCADPTRAALCVLPQPPSSSLPADIWTTIKYSFGIGLVGLVFYAGYTIVVTLLPGGSSANAIMRHAADVLRADPEVSETTGPRSRPRTRGGWWGAAA
jgi:hypothetical protein